MNLSRRQLLLALSGLSMIPLLPACGRSPEKPLVIASHVWPGYELMFLAKREGWLPASGLNLLETISATDSLAALTNGQADGAALTLDEVLRARDDGIPLTIVLVFDISAGADAVLVGPSINTLADLEGKRIGVEQTALGALMLHNLLAKAGLPVSAVTQIPIRQDGHLQTWHKQQLDAIITYEPTTTRLSAEGARRIFDSRDIPNTIFDVLAVTPDAVSRHPEALGALVAGHLRALQHFRHNPQDAAFRMAGRMGLSGREVLNSFRGLELPDSHNNRKLLAPGEDGLWSAARELSQVMTQAGLLSGEADLTDLTRTDFIP